LKGFKVGKRIADFGLQIADFSKVVKPDYAPACYYLTMLF
jgi:hypothetical protein